MNDISPKAEPVAWSIGVGLVLAALWEDVLPILSMHNEADSAGRNSKLLSKRGTPVSCISRNISTPNVAHMLFCQLCVRMMFANRLSAACHCIMHIICRRSFEKMRGVAAWRVVANVTNHPDRSVSVRKFKSNPAWIHWPLCPWPIRLTIPILTNAFGPHPAQVWTFRLIHIRPESIYITLRRGVLAHGLVCAKERTKSCGSDLVWPDAKWSATLFTNHVWRILGMHLGRLLLGGWGVVPRGVTSTASAFAYLNYTATAGNQEF